MADTPEWIQPGASATLIWHNGAGQRPDGGRIYAVAGPAFELAPRSPYFLLAPVERGEFAGRLYRGQADLADLRAFLADCVMAEGELTDEMQFVSVRAETPVLPVLEAWRADPSRPVLPYLADINGFMPDEQPLYVTDDAYAAAVQSPEHFATAWVCDECGEAEDAGVFLWTVRRGDRIRVCFLIQNDAGLWTCQLHPFEFAAEAVSHPSPRPSPQRGEGAG
ncbi:MAG TPA: hypothetical protein VFO18_15420 [Methylomirabilota bacterium]|nr:hypothetical protein [Methylomirabilota bacterium]